MEKIIGVIQRLRKNILNYNMEKSEKSFYVIIENKKCGKFFGEGPIQVAKKVASKKLKAKKEIEFYVDETGGKKKRYGPYQARKDKKTGQVSVINGRKVMKGGLLTADDITKLQNAFQQNCEIRLNQRQTLPNSRRIINIPFGFIKTKPFIFFNLQEKGKIFDEQNTPVKIIGKIFEYEYAVFEDANGNKWIFFKNEFGQILYKNFFEFFLNPDNLIVIRGNKLEVLENLINLNNQYTIGSKTYLNNEIPPELQRIINEAKKILKLLYSTNTTSSIIYSPNYSKPQIKKCVYSNLTFGILDEKNIYRGNIPVSEGNYQRFLIIKQPFFGGFSEPVIFVKIPLVGQQIFDIYIYKKDGKLYLKKINDSQNSEYLFSSISIDYLIHIENLLEYCNILYSIPFEFGDFKTVRKTADDLSKIIIQKQQLRKQQLREQQLREQQQFKKELNNQQIRFKLQRNILNQQQKELNKQERNYQEAKLLKKQSELQQLPQQNYIINKAYKERTQKELINKLNELNNLESQIIQIRQQLQKQKNNSQLQSQLSNLTSQRKLLVNNQL